MCASICHKVERECVCVCDVCVCVCVCVCVMFVCVCVCVCVCEERNYRDKICAEINNSESIQSITNHQNKGTRTLSSKILTIFL